MDIKNLYEVAPFITKDGSEIREVLAHRNSVIRNQSLAEARLPVAGSTQEHYHVNTEEIYFITHGAGRIRIEGEVRELKAGDAVAIPPAKGTSSGTPAMRRCDCCAAARQRTSTTTQSLQRCPMRERPSKAQARRRLRQVQPAHRPSR